MLGLISKSKLMNSIALFKEILPQVVTCILIFLPLNEIHDQVRDLNFFLAKILHSDFVF
jgi:hypothetical protein